MTRDTLPQQNSSQFWKIGCSQVSVGSKSTITQRGTCFPAPVSEKNLGFPSTHFIRQTWYKARTKETAKKNIYIYNIQHVKTKTVFFCEVASGNHTPQETTHCVIHWQHTLGCGVGYQCGDLNSVLITKELATRPTFVPLHASNVLKASSPPPIVLSEGIWPSGWMPCSKQNNSQHALPIWTPGSPKHETLSHMMCETCAHAKYAYVSYLSDALGSNVDVFRSRFVEMRMMLFPASLVSTSSFSQTTKTD